MGANASRKFDGTRSTDGLTASTLRISSAKGPRNPTQRDHGEGKAYCQLEWRQLMDRLAKEGADRK